MQQARSIKHGFTLIELSIVLVIIALIVAGILTGRDLIETSKIRAQVTQIEQVNTITNAFRMKYNCLPGDCKNPSELGFDGLAFALTCSFGDGVINSSSGNSMEIWIFWRQLYQAGMYPFNSRGTEVWGAVQPEDQNLIYPPGTLGKSVLVAYGGHRLHNCAPDTFVTWVEGNYIGITNPTTSSSARVFTPQQLFSIDSKMDDGAPLSGKLTALNNYYGGHYLWDVPGWSIFNAPTQGAGGSASNVCISTSTTPSSYNVQNLALLCDANIKASF
jgi:prepilin-type N-terminal cleavage/methylation domain-containing protein